MAYGVLASRGRITRDKEEARNACRQYCGGTTADSPQALRIVNY
jgi:hypothetical protein